MSDRVTGAILVGLALAIGLEASTFEVAFLTDPVGPKALPYLVAVILAGAGAVIALRPRTAPEWPGRPAWRRMGGGALSFLVFAVLLEPAGFFVACTLCVALMSTMFGASRWQSAAAGVGVSAALWGLFVRILALPLPLGDLWTR
ncbi:MAG: tripartite tricarboxylate transporter TctB family protein [Gemmatimonadota bacterium]|nr:tripartite tricarboxylate transporter TctB family protein [Gemmatimonadota bacterium]